MEVHVVTPEREVWSGEASFVVARSVEGEVGILPGHAPLLALLKPGPFRVTSADGGTSGEIESGFLSVSTTGDFTRVEILAEHVTT